MFQSLPDDKVDVRKSDLATQCEHYCIHRITESQNSRGWKGPLWVI